MKFYNKFYFFIFFVCVLLFWKFFVRGLIPLPADTIVGMYHPWRDLYAKEYPNGIPYNNPLITDPVRQQFVWKKMVIDSYKKGELPIENKYSFSGYPLLANFQSGAFYPLNLLFFILPFNFAWGVYIFLQFFLGAIFMFAFLQNILSKNANPEGVSTTEGSPHQQIAFIGAIIWILSGFWISWAEWGNILHTALWLPLILLSIDKIIERKSKIWSLIYLFSLVFSFFAGHLQTFFYLFIFSHLYLLYKTYKSKKSHFWFFVVLDLFFFMLSSIQWIPTLQFILQSARSADVQNILAREDWFIPLKHLIQLFIPDYFGNPAKGNYWGVWNYGEFLSYIGIIPIFLAILGIIKSVAKRKNLFFTIALFIVFLFTIKNPISEIPYRMQIPFFGTAQPSRLIFLLDFLLVIFFSKGLLEWLSFPSRNGVRGKLQRESSVIFILLLIIIVLSLFFQKEHQLIILRNSIQPIVIFLIFSLITLIPPARLATRSVAGRQISIIPLFPKLILPIIFLLIFFDQSRIFWRYNTFASEKYIFPETKITKFLQNELKKSFFRISSLDARIMPPNFSAYYKIPSIDGYDPLYLQSYSRLISHGKNASFNRILQLDAPDVKIFDQLKVKYVLTFDKLPEVQYRLIMSEGKTNLYEYKK